MKKKVFPKELYVKREEEKDGNVYFLAYKDIDLTVEAGEKAQIAVYELKDIKTIKARIEIEIAQKGGE